MFSPIILFPRILNGLMTGAVYALVALGLTLIYGVLHIINFAHGALLTRGLVRGLLRLQAARPRSLFAALLLAPVFFVFGYALQRFVIGPAAHGDDRNILLVTLGLAIVIENALLYAFRADTRTIDLPYAFQAIDLGFAFLPVPRVIAFAVRLRGGARALWLIMAWTDTGKAIRAVAKEKLGAAARRHRRRARLRHDLRPRHRLRRRRRLPADADLLCQPAVGNAFVLVAFTIVVLGGMGSVAGRADRRPVRSAWWRACPACSSANRSARLGIFVIFILVLLFRPTGLFGAKA